MVPCQPKQLVILSLPFAALVAFFWFKRRRSASHSDPGGTLARQKPGDKATDTSGKVDVTVACVNGKEPVEQIIKEVQIQRVSPILIKRIIEKKSENSVEESEGVKKNSGVNKSAPIIEEVVAESSKDVECAVEKVEENIAVENVFEVEKKEVICNGTAVSIKKEVGEEVEKIIFNPDLETDNIFTSTVIESEKDFEEGIQGSLIQYNQEPEEVVQDSKGPELESVAVNPGEIGATESEEANKVTEQVDDESYIFPLEDQSTVEYIPSKGVKVVESPASKDCSTFDDAAVKIDSVKDCACTSSETDTVEREENISADTGLGSQDDSAIEEHYTNMAQGQKSEEKSQNDATGLEQKLASLGLDTQQPVQRTERDSANHSPAEVMLNSPAISTFSDAHSEGSSDSGKGCSDVVTPPSRTPAGGSSVAGEQAPSVYEFVLPQVIVGRLIGRHGAFLHDIRAKTHTNVFIKKHPETNSLKICAIEGSQQDIDAALKMIRQKFPLRRFPELTLERVSFVKSPCLPINPEHLQLHLVDGVNNDVIVSSLITAGHFFLQMPMHLSYQSLYRLTCFMNSVYNTQEGPPLVEPQPNVVCVAPTHGGWYRVQIMSVDEETNTSEIKFLDYGGYINIDNGTLRQIRGDFLLLPFQAVECVLANVVPSGGEVEWSEEAKQFVQMMTTNQTLQAQVYEYTETGLPLVYLYCTQFYQSTTDPSGFETKVVLLNQELVSHGLADLIETTDEEQPPSTESS